MFGIEFEAPAHGIATAPARADVACFIGFSRRRAMPVPAELWAWLCEWGWRPHRVASEASRAADRLMHTPVPIERYDTFAALFETTRTDADPHLTWLAAAVRSFFAQGGARCFVVRVGDSWNSADITVRAANLATLLQTNSHFIAPAPTDRSQWLGVRVLHGLEGAAFVCLPDLPELVADARIEVEPLPESPAEEVFVECDVDRGPETIVEPPGVAMPACTEAGYGEWFRCVHAVGQFIASQRKDMQFLAAVPQPAAALHGNLSRLVQIARTRPGFALAGDLDSAQGIASEFVQLAWPWLGTPGGDELPGRAEPADGALAGVAARTAIIQGTHRSLGRQPLRERPRFIPIASGADLDLADEHSLINRITILGPSPSGPQVLSDQTTALETLARPASIRRLTAAIRRTAKNLGDSLAFEPSGPALWREVRRQLEALLRDFFHVGALRGETPNAAFEVSCDETTMTLNDRDAGRLIATVKFAPAVPVGLITVRLALRDSGPTET